MSWTTISSLTAPSSGVFDFPSLSLSGYDLLQIVLSGITVTTDGTDIKLTFYKSGGEVVTGYRWAVMGIASSAGVVDDGDASDPGILLNSDNANWDVGNASTKSFGASVFVPNPNSTALYKMASYQSWIVGPTGSVLHNAGAGVMEDAAAITGIKISGSSNLTAGKVKILGL